MRTNFEPGRRFANPLDFQSQLDAWCDRVNQRVHRTVRALPAERLLEEQRRMRPLPPALPDMDRRTVVRVPQQPLVRVDRNDYSISPAFAGSRAELRISQSEVTAVVLDTGELACRHRRSFAGGLTVVDPAHQTELVFAPYSTIGPARSLSSFLIQAPVGEDLAELVDHVAAGRIRPEIGWRGPFDRFPDAIDAIREGRVNGKAILDAR
jgi:hypothetical protein